MGNTDSALNPEDSVKLSSGLTSSTTTPQTEDASPHLAGGQSVCVSGEHFGGSQFTSMMIIRTENSKDKFTADVTDEHRF